MEKKGQGQEFDIVFLSCWWACWRWWIVSSNRCFIAPVQSNGCGPFVRPLGFEVSNDFRWSQEPTRELPIYSWQRKAAPHSLPSCDPAAMGPSVIVGCLLNSFHEGVPSPCPSSMLPLLSLSRLVCTWVLVRSNVHASSNVSNSVTWSPWPPSHLCSITLPQPLGPVRNVYTCWTCTHKHKPDSLGNK